MSSWNHAFVMGMHRGGTSAAARMVERLGVPLGRVADQLPPTADNPLGYGELWPVVQFNDRVLALNGWRWDAVPLSDGEIEWTAELRAEGRELVRTLGGAPLCLKDPRISVLLPLWRSVTADRIAPVVIVRHPVEVIWSLIVRNNLTPSHAAALWIAYHRRLHRSLDGLPRLLLDFGDIVDDPSGTTRLVAEFLAGNGVLDTVSAEALREASAVVDPALVRRTAPSSLEEHPLVRHATDVYESLRPRDGEGLPTGRDPVRLDPDVEVLVADLLESRRTAADHRHEQVVPPKATAAVSVVLVLGDDHDAARASLQSALDQTRPPSQIVAVGSSAATEALARAWGALSDAHGRGATLDTIVLEGPSRWHARNAGIEISTGELISFLDEGEAWGRLHLQALGAPFDTQPGLGWCTSDFDLVDGAGRHLVTGWLGESGNAHPRRSLGDLVRRPPNIVSSASVIRRSALDEVGMFDPEVEGLATDDLYIRMFQAGWQSISTADSFMARPMWDDGGPEGRASVPARLAFFTKILATFPESSPPDLAVVRAEIRAKLSRLHLLEYSAALAAGDLPRAREIARRAEQHHIAVDNSRRMRLRMWMMRRPRLMRRARRMLALRPGRIGSQIVGVARLRRRSAGAA